MPFVTQFALTSSRAKYGNGIELKSEWGRMKEAEDEY